MKNTDFNIKGLYRIQKQDIMRCAKVAAKAFFDDVSCQFLLDKKLTYKSLYDYYLVIYNAAYNKMYMFADSKNIDGIIITAPIKDGVLSFFDCLKEGALKLILSQGLGVLYRSLSYENNCIKMRNKIANNKSWYIFQFCVIPEKQGKKIGSKIIRPVLEWMDLNNINCYLETQNCINVKIYNHFGFSLKMTGTLPDKTNKQFAMYRGISKVS